MVTMQVTEVRIPNNTTPAPLPMTMTAKGMVPTHLVEKFLKAEAARMRTDIHPEV